MSVYYGASGDVRSDLNGGLPTSHANYQGEAQIGGDLIERGRRYSYSVINGKLKDKYGSAVPWVAGAEPALIYEISNKLTQCFVINAKNLGNEPLDKAKREDLCDTPRKLLDDIADGGIELPESDNPLGAKVYHNKSGYTPIFDIDPTLNAEPDSDLLDEIENDRS